MYPHSFVRLFLPKRKTEAVRKDSERRRLRSSVHRLPTWVLRRLSKSSPLFLGNSMPIRVHVSQFSDEELLAKLGVKKRAKPRELERPHQVALIKWVRTVRDIFPVLKLLYAVSNGGDRNLRVARKLKAEGVLAGVADLCLPAARRGYHGLYIEMKSEVGSATKEQKEFLRGVSREGYCAVIAHGFDEAKTILEWYIGATDHEPLALKTTLIRMAHNSGRQRERRKK
jgi:VRR-NUC domain